LLQKAQQLGLVRELNDRLTWRCYVARDIATELDLEPRLRGRPQKRATAPEPKADYQPMYDALAASLADIDKLIGLVPSGEDN
jgi:hypothetical protein